MFLHKALFLPAYLDLCRHNISDACGTRPTGGKKEFIVKANPGHALNLIFSTLLSRRYPIPLYIFVNMLQLQKP